MNNYELASFIRKNFVPFAFRCECNGEDVDCSRTMNQDVYAIAQYETAERIARAIEGMESL